MNPTLIRKVPGNAAGRYYVDLDSCTCCGLCYGEVPEHFAFGNLGAALVFNQPVSEPQIARAEEARSICPVDAIHNDGDAEPLASSATLAHPAPAAASF